MYQAYRKENKFVFDVPLYEEFTSSEDMDYADKELDFINVATLKKIVNASSEFEQDVIRLRILGYSQKKIADKLGVSQANISRVIKKFKLKYEEMRKLYDR